MTHWRGEIQKVASLKLRVARPRVDRLLRKFTYINFRTCGNPPWLQKPLYDAFKYLKYWREHGMVCDFEVTYSCLCILGIRLYCDLFLPFVISFRVAVISFRPSWSLSQCDLFSLLAWEPVISFRNSPLNCPVISFRFAISFRFTIQITVHSHVTSTHAVTDMSSQYIL